MANTEKSLPPDAIEDAAYFYGWLQITDGSTDFPLVTQYQELKKKYGSDTTSFTYFLALREFQVQFRISSKDVERFRKLRQKYIGKEDSPEFKGELEKLWRKFLDAKESGE